MIAYLMANDYNINMKRFLFLFLAILTFTKVMVFPQEAEEATYEAEEATYETEEVICETEEATYETEEVVYPPNAILNAAYMGDIEMMKRILATNPDKDVRDAMGGTALHVAIFKSNFEAMKLLLENGFDINATVSSNGFTPLHYCVWFNNVDAARFLLLCNADRNIKDSDGLTPLEKAAKESKRDMMLVLSRR